MAATYKSFGRTFNPAALTAAREKAGLTYASLGSLLGVDANKAAWMVKRWETGRAKPSAPSLQAIVRVLKCSLDDLAPKVERPQLPPQCHYKPSGYTF